MCANLYSVFDFKFKGMDVITHGFHFAIHSDVPLLFPHLFFERGLPYFTWIGLGGAGNLKTMFPNLVSLKIWIPILDNAIAKKV